MNNTCVLGYTHQNIVGNFQTIRTNETISLEVCRGYPLPFDPNDPNTEIVTTMAVTAPEKTNTHNVPPLNSSSNHPHSGLNASQRSIKSMPDLTNMQKHNHIGPPGGGSRNKSFDQLDTGDSGVTDALSVFPSSAKPEMLSVNITKGNMGFGFTIADSAYGQKVKQILDKSRCTTLLEGDILVEINHHKVKDMPHTEVVQILKDCPRGLDATIVVQRGGR